MRKSKPEEVQEVDCGRVNKTERRHLTGGCYLVPGADFSLLVVWVRCSLVQLGPQRFGLPVVQPLLQLAVEVPEILGIEVQLPAQLGKVLLHIFAVLRLDKVVEGCVRSVGRILVGHDGGGRRLAAPAP